MAQEQMMTTAEYLRTPESPVPTELIYGKLRVADAPMPRHQRVVRDLCFALVDHAESQLGSNLIERASFDERIPIRSRVLPDFDRTLASMLRWQ
jgi:hypothetical protein